MAQTNDVRAGWRAPNFRDAKEKDKFDLFTLSLIICFTLSGFHPFGSLRQLSQRQNDIHKGCLKISEVLVSPEFVHLISSLTKIRAADRADPNHLLGHPAFWTRTKNALFLCTTHGLMKTLSKKQFKEFNKKNSRIFSDKRKRKMPTCLLKQYTKKSKEHYANNDPNFVEEKSALYDPYYDVATYLRLVRNVFKHLPQYKGILPNSLDEAYEQLVLCNAPLLPIETYKFFVEEHTTLYDPHYDVGKYLRLVRNVFLHLIEYKDILPNLLEEAYKQLVEHNTPLLLIETYKFFERFINKEPVLRDYYYVCGKSQENV